MFCLCLVFVRFFLVCGRLICCVVCLSRLLCLCVSALFELLCLCVVIRCFVCLFVLLLFSKKAYVFVVFGLIVLVFF